MERRKEKKIKEKREEGKKENQGPERKAGKSRQFAIIKRAVPTRIVTRNHLYFEVLYIESIKEQFPAC